MTREEAKAHYRLMKDKWVELDIDEYTDIIYNNFESRTCENCAAYYKEYCLMFESHMGKDDYCSKFEKMNKKDLELVF